MSRPRGSKNKARGERVAEQDCPKRKGCRMYLWYCDERCKEREGCAIYPTTKVVGHGCAGGIGEHESSDK